MKPRVVTCFVNTALKWLTLVLSMVLASFSTTSYAISAKDISQFTLKNGMKIIVLEDHSIPNANMYTFWKVGSRNEHIGITGLSHFFEHMMFNGAKKYGPKMFDRVMEANGGSNNAYTTENLTVYTNWFPSQSLAVIFDLEADRIANLAFDPKIVESERGVVASERTTGLENSNYRAISELVKNAAFRAHSYSWPVIGYESDIQHWRMSDLKNYHKTYYAPNNAVVVIAGDVTLSQVKKLAQQYFAPIPRGPEPRPVTTVEPKQQGERSVYLSKPSVSSANILMGWHVPNTQHPDFYALDMLSDILSEGKSSRLQQYLVEQQKLATSQFSYVPKSIDPNLFYVYATARKEVTAAQLKQGIIQVINNIIKNGVSQQELEKVKNNKTVNFYRTLETINGKANTIGSYELYFGSFQKLFDAPKYYQAVTPADIQRVAKTYLIKANRTTGILAAQEDSNENDI